MKAIINKVIVFVKKDSTYKLDEALALTDVLMIVFSRATECFRGLGFCLLSLRKPVLFFKGRNVKISHSAHLKFGSGFLVGDYSKVHCLSQNGLVFGRNVSIGRCVEVISTAVVSNVGVGISVGNNVGINSNCFIGGQGGVSIEDDVIIGPGVRIFSENHNFGGDGLIRKQGETRSRVVVGRDSWLGAGAVLLPGVVLGSKTIVAAGAVVCKSFEGGVVLAGCPARVVKRF